MKKLVSTTVLLIFALGGCLQAQHDVPVPEVPFVVLGGHTGPVCSAVFSPDGKKVLTGSEDCTARIWDVGSGKCLHELKGHRFQVRDVAFFPDGKNVFTSSADNARIWNSETGEALQRLVADRVAIVRFTALSPDGKRVAMGCGDKTTRIWDTDSGKELHRLAHASEAHFVAFSPDGKQLVTLAKSDVRIWDTDTGDELHKLEERSKLIRFAAFSPDGKKIVLAGLDEAVGNSGREESAQIWGVASEKALYRLVGHGNWIASVSFSSDGTRIVTSSNDGTARVWDVDTGEELCRLLDHPGVASCAAFSPDGTLVVSGGGVSNVHGTPTAPVHLFDAISGEKLYEWHDHTRFIQSVAFSPDGKKIVSASDDSTARIWNLDPPSGDRDARTWYVK